MKRTIFTVIIMFILVMFFAACGWNVEIVDPTEPSESETEISSETSKTEDEISSETSETKEEISSGLKIIQERADKHIFEYEFQYNEWMDELAERGIFVSFSNRKFTGEETWEAELVLKNNKAELSIPFSGLYDFNGDIDYGKVLFPDDRTAVFCGNGKAVFFDTETLEVWDFEPEFPDFEKENLWINGVGINERDNEIIYFVTLLDNFQTEKAETRIVVFNKNGITEMGITKLRGTYGDKELSPYFFNKSTFFEYKGEAFLHLGYDIISLDNGIIWEVSMDKTFAEKGNHGLEITTVNPKEGKDISPRYLALLYENGKVINSMMFSEPDFFIVTNNEEAVPELEVLDGGKKAVYTNDYFAMKLTLDFENQTHDFGIYPTDANIDEYSEPINSPDGKYSLCSFGFYGGGDMMFALVSVRNNVTGEHTYFGEKGGMYGGYGGMGFLKNNDIYSSGLYELKIFDPETLEVKFDINKNFPLGYDAETNSGRGLLTFRRDPNDFSFIVVYYEYENGIAWYDYQGNFDGGYGIGDCNYKIGFLDSEGNLIESYDTGFGIRSDPFGINDVEMRYSAEKLSLIAIGGKGGVSFEGSFDMKTKTFTSPKEEPKIKVPDIFSFTTMIIAEGEEILEEDYIAFSEEEKRDFISLLRIGTWQEVPENWQGKGSVLEPANILKSEKDKTATMYLSPEDGKTLIILKWGKGQKYQKYYFASKEIAFEAEEFRKELAEKYGR